MEKLGCRIFFQATQKLLPKRCDGVDIDGLTKSHGSILSTNYVIIWHRETHNLIFFFTALLSVPSLAGLYVLSRPSPASSLPLYSLCLEHHLPKMTEMAGLQPPACGQEISLEKKSNPVTLLISKLQGILHANHTYQVKSQSAC